jgi:hypothetical protein
VMANMSLFLSIVCCNGGGEQRQRISEGKHNIKPMRSDMLGVWGKAFPPLPPVGGYGGTKRIRISLIKGYEEE